MFEKTENKRKRGRVGPLLKTNGGTQPDAVSESLTSVLEDVRVTLALAVDEGGRGSNRDRRQRLVLRGRLLTRSDSSAAGHDGDNTKDQVLVERHFRMLLTRRNGKDRLTPNNAYSSNKLRSIAGLLDKACFSCF